jgi:transcriptional regulator with XRE-family HTH domain
VWNIVRGSRLVLENIGLELICTRKSLGWTQRQLADRLGVSEQYVQKLEKTKYAKTQLATLIRVATALDISIGYSLSDND